MTQKNKVDRAGVIPFYIKDGEPLFLFMVPSNPKYGGDEFQIAKGKVEEHELPENAALREGGEELGLVESNIEQYTFLGKYLGRTWIYLAHIKDESLFNKPHFETGDTRWMTNKQFQEEGRKLHRIIVQEAYDKIHSREPTRNTTQQEI